MAKKQTSSEPKHPAPMKKRRTKSPAVSEQIRNDLAQKALAKRRAGKEPTQRELAALVAYEQETKHGIVLEYLDEMPQGMFIRLTGRPAKVIYEQARTYGLPIDTNPINLKAALTAYHDLFAKHGKVFRGQSGHKAELNALTKRDKEASVRKKELEIGEMEGTLVRKRDADHARMDLLKTVRGIIERAPSDLAVRLMKAGVPPNKTKRIVETYYTEILNDWIKVSRQQNGKAGK